ncbi:hypothetical protein GUJ93_ZPchr0010g10784 [Zizania palustris]|uniref:non-specific serine/threonine protein kinase n=1 Tax=Zizania palustris TaxID=103762 RepID=A0A8J5WAK4_ZIZPA|nr:hypothetical protein GUJ93_ZPchr0010g10784 [Zizania palustris]
MEPGSLHTATNSIFTFSGDTTAANSISTFSGYATAANSIPSFSGDTTTPDAVSAFSDDSTTTTDAIPAFSSDASAVPTSTSRAGANDTISTAASTSLAANDAISASAQTVSLTAFSSSISSTAHSSWLHPITLSWHPSFTAFHVSATVVIANIFTVAIQIVRNSDLYGQWLPVTSPQQSHPLSSPLTSTPPQPQAYLPWQSSGGGGGDPWTPPAVIGGTASYADLEAATGGFSDGNLLGEGGFGHVYRGTLRGGQEVAIKKLRPGSGQGDREFHAEVEIISRVHHRNLVSLVDYCIYGDQRLLVYEYVPNNTLEFHLHGSGRPTLDWPRRWKIAVGAAKGLAYLHEDCRPKIIHRDIKAANILLDYNFEPKVADFGLAKIQSGEDTHVSTRVMGTFGYLAPEYATTGKVNDRSDVFSFGVVLLELITGRRPVQSAEPYNDETLVSWARPLLIEAIEEQVVDELIDPVIGANYDAHDMQRLITCAAGAVRYTARSRPRMIQIVRYLEGELSMEELNAGVAPGQSLLHLHGHSSGTTEQMRRLRRTAFLPDTGTVAEDASSDYLSELTSEYGLYPSSSSSSGDTGEVGTQTATSQPHAGTADGAGQPSAKVTGTSQAMSRRTRPSGRAGRLA